MASQTGGCKRLTATVTLVVAAVLSASSALSRNSLSLSHTHRHAHVLNVACLIFFSVFYDSQYISGGENRGGWNPRYESSRNPSNLHWICVLLRGKVVFGLSRYSTLPHWTLLLSTPPFLFLWLFPFIFSEYFTLLVTLSGPRNNARKTEPNFPMIDYLRGFPFFFFFLSSICVFVLWAGMKWGRGFDFLKVNKLRILRTLLYNMLMGPLEFSLLIVRNWNNENCKGICYCFN